MVLKLVVADAAAVACRSTHTTVGGANKAGHAAAGQYRSQLGLGKFPRLGGIRADIRRLARSLSLYLCLACPLSLSLSISLSLSLRLSTRCDCTSLFAIVLVWECPRVLVLVSTSDYMALVSSTSCVYYSGGGREAGWIMRLKPARLIINVERSHLCQHIRLRIICSILLCVAKINEAPCLLLPKTF